MASLIRVRCVNCESVVDLRPDEIIVNISDTARSVVFTCPSCDAFCDKLINAPTESILYDTGVLNVDKLAAWIIEDLTGETSG